LNGQSFIEEMFKTEPEIRYIAIVDTNYRVITSKQREGVPSFALDETIRNFVSIVPHIIIESVEKLAPFLGKVGGVTAHYANCLVIFYKIDNLISFQPHAETPF
jgi:hypothetical protein